MNDKITKNLSLSLLLGLFAVYGHTVHDLRVGSVSTAGLKVKYRGLASIDCPPVDSVDSLKKDDSSVCQHYIKVEDVKVSGADHIKITAVALHKGQTTKGSTTIASDHPDAKNLSSLKKDFIVDLLKESSKKAAEVKKNTIVLKEESKEEPIEKVVEEEIASAIGEDGLPKPVVPSSSSERIADKDDKEKSSSSVDFSEDDLDSAIEIYRNLQDKANSCSYSADYNKKISKLTKDFDEEVASYESDIDTFKDSTTRNAFDMISSTDKITLEEFIAETQKLERADDTDSINSADQIQCLSAQALNIKDKTEQFDFYDQNINPIVKDALQAGSLEELAANTKEINQGNLLQLINSNPSINAVATAEGNIATLRVAKQSGVDLSAADTNRLENAINKAANTSLAARESIAKSVNEYKNLTQALFPGAGSANQVTGGATNANNAQGTAALSTSELLKELEARNLKRVTDAPYGQGSARRQAPVATRNGIGVNPLGAAVVKQSPQQLQRQRLQQQQQQRLAPQNIRRSLQSIVQ